MRRVPLISLRPGRGGFSKSGGPTGTRQWQRLSSTPGPGVVKRLPGGRQRSVPSWTGPVSPQWTLRHILLSRDAVWPRGLPIRSRRTLEAVHRRFGPISSYSAAWRLASVWRHPAVLQYRRDKDGPRHRGCWSRTRGDPPMCKILEAPSRSRHGPFVSPFLATFLGCGEYACQVP